MEESQENEMLERVGGSVQGQFSLVSNVAEGQETDTETTLGLTIRSYHDAEARFPGWNVN